MSPSTRTVSEAGIRGSPTDRSLPPHEAFPAGLIAASKEAFLAQYPEGRFVVLLYPRFANTEYDSKDMVPLLEEREIETLDLTRRIRMSQPGRRIPIDGHPSAAAQQKVAEALAGFLRGSPAE